MKILNHPIILLCGLIVSFIYVVKTIFVVDNIILNEAEPIVIFVLCCIMVYTFGTEK